MLLFCKYSAVFATVFLLFGSADANSFSLWDIAKPVPTGKFTSLGSGGDVFTFTTPPGAHSCIELWYQFYSDVGCGTALGTWAYQRVSVGAEHANKTFYINASSLYAIANAATATTARCAKEVDRYSHLLENVISAPISCSSGTNQCTSPSTHALPATLTSDEAQCA